MKNLWLGFRSVLDKLGIVHRYPEDLSKGADILHVVSANLLIPKFIATRVSIGPLSFWSRAPILLWELRLNVEPSRSGTTVMGTLPPRRADEECLRSFAAERNRPCPCPPRNREP